MAVIDSLFPLPKNLSRTVLALLLFLCGVHWVDAQVYPILKMQKFYGFRGNDTPKRIRKAMDGNLLIGGDVTEEDGAGSCTNAWLIKVTPGGKLLWEREIGGSGCEELRDFIQTPDSGIIFSGLTSSFISHPEKGQEAFQGDYFIGKLNSRGNIEWIKAYGGLDVDQAYAITGGRNGEYVVAGVSNSQNFDVEKNHGMADLWTLKIHPNGDKKSSLSYGGTKADWAYSVATCFDGDYVYAGFSNSEDIDGTRRRANGDGWIMRTDRYGDRIWQRIYSGKFEDYFTRVIEDKDGRLIVVGNFESESLGKQFWFLKLTAEGKKIYEKIFGLPQDEFLTSVAECKDGGYILSGYSHYYNWDPPYTKGGDDFWLIRVDQRGDVIWRETYGGKDNEAAYDVIEYEPGVFYAIGTKYNDFELAGNRDKKMDWWLLRVDEQRCDDVDINISLSLKDYTAYVKRAFKLRASSSIGDSYLWDFGDGNTSRDKEPSHTYEMPGVYEVKLTVFVNENCAKTYVLPELIMVW